MDATTATATGTSSRLVAAKVLGSVGVVGVAAAIAGIGTFGTFTDSTAPVSTSVHDGVVSIALTADDGTASVPLDFSGIAAGGSVTQRVDLVDDGDTGLASVELATTATTSSVLDSNRVDGLRMSVRSCSVAWSGSTCAGTARDVLAAGPVVRTLALADPFSLARGGVDHLAITLSLPSSAGDAFKDAASRLALTFTATQRNGTDR